MGYISDEKLYAPFNRVNTLEMDYVKKAKEIAETIAAGGELDIDDLAFVREASTNDRKNLKGDFVISCFLDMIDSFNRWEGGKRIRISDDQIARIYRNDMQGGSVSHFCNNERLTRTKYYRIKNMDVKDAESRERLETIKRQVAAEFENEQQKL